MLLKQNLLPITEYYIGKVRSELNIPTESYLDDFCNKYNLKKDNFYLANGIHEPFVYWDGEFLAFSFMCFDEEFLINIGIRRLPRTKELLSLGVVNFFRETSFVFQMFLLEQNLNRISDAELTEILDGLISPYHLKTHVLSDELKHRLKRSFIEKKKIKNLFSSKDLLDVYVGAVEGVIGTGEWCTSQLSTAFLSSVSINSNKVGELFGASIGQKDVIYYNEASGVLLLESKKPFKKVNLLEFEDKKPEVNSIYNKHKDILSVLKGDLLKITKAFSVAVVIALVARENRISRDERDVAMLLALLNGVYGEGAHNDHLSLPKEFVNKLAEKQIQLMNEALKGNAELNSLVAKANELVGYVLGVDEFKGSSIKEDEEWFKFSKIAFCLNFEE